jgi:glycosyltransferase involved in cell wall biosynthesis
MRIWIINHYALPPTSAGGNRHYNIARQLIKRGHEVIIIAANYNHFTHAYIPSPAKIGNVDQTFAVPFIWIPTPPYRGNTMSRFWNMLVFSWRLLFSKYLPNNEPPDVIIGSSPHLFSAFSAEILSRRFKIPFLFEVRDIWPDTLVELGRISRKHPLIQLMKYIELRLYRRAQRVISLLPAADTYFINNGVARDDIFWLPNAIDPETMPTNLESRSRQKFTVMYAGAHGLANDLDTVLDAAKLLMKQSLDQDICICLAGEGPDKLRLKQRVLNENIHMIQFIDAVPKNEVFQLLNNADVFLMLLRKSPVFRWGISPNKLFDYLMMGRPVIFGVDTPFNPIEKCNAGISIHPGNPVLLATAITKLYNLPEYEREEMGVRGREYVMKHHDISNLTEALENMLMNTVNLTEQRAPS